MARQIYLPEQLDMCVPSPRRKHGAWWGDRHTTSQDEVWWAARQTRVCVWTVE